MITGLNTYIRIGKIEVHRLPELRIISERHRPLTRMQLVLPDPTGNIFRAVTDRDPVSIVLGYRDQAPGLWEGWVKSRSVMKNPDQLVINTVGMELPVVETIIRETFIRETPEAIVKYAISQAGFQPGRIDSIGATFPRFVASSIPVWQVARQCEHTLARAYGVDMNRWAFWRGKDGKINWCPGDEPADIPVIESQDSLIRHSPGEGRAEFGRVEAFLLPDFMHSMRFRLADQKRSINNTFRAVKVEHVLRDSSARTFISYGAEYERY